MKQVYRNTYWKFKTAECIVGLKQIDPKYGVLLDVTTPIQKMYYVKDDRIMTHWFIFSN